MEKQTLAYAKQLLQGTDSCVFLLFGQSSRNTSFPTNITTNPIVSENLEVKQSEINLSQNLKNNETVEEGHIKKNPHIKSEL